MDPVTPEQNGEALESFSGRAVSPQPEARSRRGGETASPWLPAGEDYSPPSPKSASVWRTLYSTRRLARSFLSSHSPRRHLNGMLSWTSLNGNFTLWILGLLLVWVLVQTIVVEVSMNSTRQRGLQIGAGVRKLTGNETAEFADEMAKAFGEWKLLQEQLPDTYANFSQFLIQEKMKEKHLRKRLSRLSKKSLAFVADIIVPPAQAPPQYSKEEELELKWSYLSMEKAWPYVGSDRYLDRFRVNSRHYFNSLAVFPHANRTRLHGLVGLYPNGTRAWKPDPMPPKIDDFPGGKALALEDGGFYLNLSNALPLDRDIADQREDFCHDEVYNLEELEDASVIITFYNEHLSTLLRSVHSVLNLTPPPLLREIILVDDHSNNTANMPGGYIYEYVKLLPKVKLMRLPERRGLVQARLTGAKFAKAPVIVVLDSHIEVNPVWLEPQLKRLQESPRSVVFPQILSMDSETLEHRSDSGIGCFLSFKWIMQERPYFGKMVSAEPVPSASMAGGLFAVRRDWFFESGAYDEEFSMWGAENVEMGFRVWMCGGRVECTPCARTYHIYRHGGAGYRSPHEFIKKNRVRTARLWLDEYYQIAKYFNDPEGVDEGSYDKMLELKERLQCKSFQWFLENVDPGRDGTKMDDFGLMGSIGHPSRRCIDNLGHRNAPEEYGLYYCHGMGGSQGWFESKKSRQIRNMSHETTCMSREFKLSYCDQKGKDDRWRSVPSMNWIVWGKSEKALESDNFEADYDCLAVVDNKLAFKPCVKDDQDILWDFQMFETDPNFKPLEISAARKEILRKRAAT